MKKSYIKNKNLSKRIIMAVALGVGMPSVLTGVARAETIYHVSGYDAYVDQNDLNGSSTIGRNIVEIGGPHLHVGNGPVGNVILGNFVANLEDLVRSHVRGYPAATVVGVTGDSFTADNVNVFTLVYGQKREYNASSLNVQVDNSASFGNMSNTLTGSLLVPKKAMGELLDDGSTTLSTEGFAYRNGNITVQAKDITTKVITVKGTSGQGPSSTFSYTASNNIETGDINTEAEGNVVLSADNNISLGSVTRTAGADEGDGVTPGKTEVTKANKLTIDGITIGEGSFVASHVSDTVQINKNISASSQTKAVSINIDSSKLATIKGSTAQGAKASISFTGGGVEASGVAKSIDGGKTTFETGHENISVAGAEATGTNSRVKLRSEYHKVNINGDAVSKSGGTIEASSDYDDITVTGAVKTESGGQVNINARMGKVSASKVAAKDANSTVSISGEGTEITGAVEATNGASATIDGTSSSGEVGSASATGENSKVELRGESVTVNNTLSVKEKGAIDLKATSGEATVNKDIDAKGGNINITATREATVGAVVAEIDEHNVIGTVNIAGSFGTTTAASIKASGTGSTVNLSGHDATVTNGVMATDGAKATVKAKSAKSEVGSASATGENSTVEISGRSVAVDNTLSAKDKGTINLSSTSDEVTVDKDIDAKGGNINITASDEATVGAVVAETDEHNVVGKVTIDGGTGKVTAASTKASGAGSIANLSGRYAEVTGAVDAENGGQTTVDGGTGTVTVASTKASGAGSIANLSGRYAEVTGAVDAENGGQTTVRATSRDSQVGSVNASGDNSKIEISGDDTTVTGDISVADKSTTNITATSTATISGNISSKDNAAMNISSTSDTTISGNVSSKDKATTKITATSGEVSIGKYDNSTVDADGGSVIITATSGVSVGGAVSASAHENNAGSVSLDAGSREVKTGGASASGENSNVTITGGTATFSGGISASDKATTNITATSGGVTVGQYGTQGVEATGGTVAITGSSGVVIGGSVSSTSSEDKGGSTTIDGGTGAVTIDEYDNNDSNVSATGEDSKVELKGASVVMGGNLTAEDNAITKINVTGEVHIGQFHKNGPSRVQANGATVQVNGGEGVTIDGVVTAVTKDGTAGSTTVDGGSGKTTVAVGAANGDGSQLSITGTGVEATNFVGASGGATTSVDAKSEKAIIKLGSATGSGSALSITGTGVETDQSIQVYQGATVDVDGKTGKTEIQNAAATDADSVMNIKGATTVVTDTVISRDKSIINITASDKAVVGGDAERGSVVSQAGTININGAHGAAIRGNISSEASDDGVGEINVDGGDGKVSAVQVSATSGSKARITGIGAEVEGVAVANDGATTIIDGKTGDVEAGKAGALGENSQLELKGDKATVDTVIRTDQGGTAKITGDKGATIGNDILSDNGGSAIVDAGTGEALVGTDDLIVARLTAAHKGSIEFVGNGATVNGGLDSEEGGTVSVDGKSGAASIYGSIITNSKDTNNKNEITVEGSTANVTGDLSVNNGQVSVKGKKALGGSTTVVNVNVAANGTVDLGDSKTDTIIKGDVSTAEGLTADAPAELNIHGKTITYLADKEITGNANSVINVGDKDSTESISVKEASANGDNSVVNIKAKGTATLKTIKATKGGKISLDTKPANITNVEADGDGSVATVDSDGVIGDIDKAFASNKGKIVLHTTDIFTIESKDKPQLSTDKGGRITVKADKGIIAKTKITANGVDYTSKGEVNIMDVDTDPNNPNSTEISGKDVTTKDFNAKAGGSIGITGDRSINVDGDIIADGKDANIEVAHKHNELKLLAAPGKLIEAKNGGHIVLTSPDGIDITAPNVIADGADTSAQAQPGTPSAATKPGAQAQPGTPASPSSPSAAAKTSDSPKITTLVIGTVDADNNPTVTKDVKLVDLEAYHGARVRLASQAEIKVQSAKTNTEGQIRFYSTKADDDGVTITNLSTVEAARRPEPKPVVKKATKTEVATAGNAAVKPAAAEVKPAPAEVKPAPVAVKPAPAAVKPAPAAVNPAPAAPVAPVATVENGPATPVEDIVPAKPADPEYASIIIDSKNSHIVNLTGSTDSDKLGRILIQDAGDTLRIDKFQAGAQEFGLDIYYSPEAIKTINPAGKVDTDRLIITNGTSTPQTLAIKDIAFDKAFDTLTAAKDAAKKAGNRRFTPLIPFAAVLNPSSHENTFRVNVAPIKWNLGKELKDRLVVQRKPYDHHKFAPQFKNYFNKLSDHELIYFVALKVIPSKIFVDSVLSNGEQIYNLATGNNLGVNRGYGMVKGIQAHNSVGMWTEAYTSRMGYKGLYHGTLNGLNIGYNLKSNKKATVGISVDYASNSGSLAWTSTHTTSKVLALNVYKHGTLKDKLYYSLQARLGQAKASFACNDDGEIVTGNQKANFGQISGEVDKMKQLKHGKYLSTQGELRLTRIGGKDYDASNEVTLKTDNMTSVLSRIGVVYGQERTNAKGLNSSYYMSFNIFHEFAGNVKLMTIDDIGEEYNYAVSNKGTWGSFGIGYRTQLSAKTSAFLDYGHTLGGHRSIGTLHMGAKWLF